MTRFDLQGARRAAYKIATGGLVLARNGLAVVGLLVVCTVVWTFGREDGVTRFNQYLTRNIVMHSVEGGFLPQSLTFLTNAFQLPSAQVSTLLGLDPLADRQRGDDGDSLIDTDARPGLLDVAVPPSNKEQKAVTNYIVRKYRVNRTAVELLVAAAWSTGREMGMDPTLLLAVMAMESSFNPFAESTMGAQGLMQVMTRVHQDKLEPFGGSYAVLNPVVNLKVGAMILKDCIRRGGSLEEGLRLYVGAVTSYDGVYGQRVMAEQRRMAAAARSAVERRI